MHSAESFAPEIPRVRLVDSGEAGLAILKINQVRNVFHEGAQQSALLLHFLDQFEVHHRGGDLGLQLERFPRLGDIREDLSAIDRFGERAHVGISGHHDAGGFGNFSHTPQKLVPADPGHALIAQDDRDVVFRASLRPPRRRWP
jgi:hypothetical protein